MAESCASARVSVKERASTWISASVSEIPLGSECGRSRQPNTSASRAGSFGVSTNMGLLRRSHRQDRPLGSCVRGSISRARRTDVNVTAPAIRHRPRPLRTVPRAGTADLADVDDVERAVGAGPMKANPRNRRRSASLFAHHGPRQHLRPDDGLRVGRGPEEHDRDVAAARHRDGDQHREATMPPRTQQVYLLAGMTGLAP